MVERIPNSTCRVLSDIRNCILDLGGEMEPDLQRRILSVIDHLRDIYCPNWNEIPYVPPKKLPPEKKKFFRFPDEK